MEVGEFVFVAAGMFRMRKFHIFEERHGGAEFLAVAHDANVSPHKVADLCQRCCYGGRGGSIFRRSGNCRRGFCGM